MHKWASLTLIKPTTVMFWWLFQFSASRNRGPHTKKA
uniref:Uncharacterized protein n=1 Tax=Anguilla anguilla TaxID=7936 RepID=A0A0E9PTF1_ANGAN